MSRYGYDYSLTPGHPKGWRPLFRNALVVGTIVAVSAVSGGVVALDLLGPGSGAAHRTALAAPQAQPASVRVARAVAPAPQQPAARAPANAGAAVETPQIVAAMATAALPSTTPAPLAVANAAPTVTTATVEEPKTVRVPESELTFTTGYARRRAVQTAATTGAGTKSEVALVEEQNQIGRSGRVKPRTTVARQTADARRVADAREEQPVKFDVARHQQALALGDARATRRAPPQQQGGLFSNNPFGGFFRSLF